MEKLTRKYGLVLSAKENGQFSFPVLFYLIVFAVIMLIGGICRKPSKSNKKES